MMGWRTGGEGQEKGSVGSAELELAPISDMGLLLQVALNARLIDFGLTLL